MKGWLLHHARSLSRAFGRYSHAPLGSALNMMVIGIALSLPAGLYVIIDNLQSSARAYSLEPQISVFMALDATRADALQAEARLKKHPGVQKYRFVPREQALLELKQASGLADVMDTLTSNPLPDAFVVHARLGAPAALDALRAELQQWPRVAHVQLDAEWARRLDASLRLATIIVAAIAALLAVALAAVTFNTIRLQVLTQRDEIEVVKLIGATDAFIRRPFLYFGALQGAAGGLLAWGLVGGGIYLLNRNLGELSHVYATLFQLRALSLHDGLAVVALATFLGWLGALLSVNRHLAKIDAGAHK